MSAVEMSITVVELMTKVKRLDCNAANVILYQ